MTASNGRTVTSSGVRAVGPSAINNRMGPQVSDNGGVAGVVSRDSMDLEGSELGDARKRKRNNNGTASGAAVLSEPQTTTIDHFLLAGPGRQTCQEK